MSIRKLRAGRVSGVVASEWIGPLGTIFYNELTGTLRISDGVTPGGQPLQLVAEDFAFSFGDFVATTETTAPFGATLMSAEINQDINIVSNGTGSIHVIGQFDVYKTDADVAGALASPPIFSVTDTGQVQMLVPDANTSEGAVTIVGGLDGVYQPPVNSGVMLHITGIAGTPGVPSRIYNDAQNSFAAFVARRYNNTAAAPSAVLDGEEIMRISGTAHNGTIIPGSGNQRIIYKALGNQTLTNQGGSMEFWATPLNSIIISKVATLTSAGITLESGKVLSGNVTIGSGNTLDVTGATVTGLTLGGLNPADVAGTMTGTTIKSTVTGSSLTSVGTLTNLTVTNTISGSINGTAAIATTVTLVATNTTDAAHYLTFVDTVTGNENVRTDTGLTYNPGTNKLTVGSINTKLFRNSRDAGTIAAAGTLTLDFSTDDLVYCVWSDGMTLAYQNFTAGSVVRVMATKATGSGTDSISLGGVTAALVSSGNTTISSQADVTVFMEFTCIGTTIGTVYVKL